MTEVSFYHLQRTSLEQALPRLLEKVLERGLRAVVMGGSDERMEMLNSFFWTYNERSFLPHGRACDGRSADQPVYLSTTDENPNSAQVLVLVDGMSSRNIYKYDRCLDLFDGADEVAVEAARGRWRDNQASGHSVIYWMQAASGGWEKQI